MLKKNLNFHFTATRLFTTKLPTESQEIKKKVNEKRTHFAFFESKNSLAISTATSLRTCFVRKGKQSQRESNFHKVIKLGTVASTKKATPAQYFQSFYYSLAPFVRLKIQKPKAHEQSIEFLPEKVRLRSRDKSKKEGCKLFVKSFHTGSTKKNSFRSKFQTQIDTLGQSFNSPMPTKQKPNLSSISVPPRTGLGVQKTRNNIHERALTLRPEVLSENRETSVEEFLKTPKKASLDFVKF